MNRDYVLFNLREAKEELERTIHEMQDNPEYDYGEFVVAMSHLYHHLNTAWNAQNSTTSQAEGCSQEDFDRWRQFPDPVDLLLV
jgi:hypothetical protein